MDSKYYYSKVIHEYDIGRARYSAEMIRQIIEYSGVDDTSKILEVGAGPGTATESMTDYHVDVLEITDEQCQYLRQKFADNPNIKVYNQTFEEFEGESYDLIYSANAFHWIDAEYGYKKAAQMLKPGGILSVFWNLSFSPMYQDGALARLQEITRRYFRGYGFGLPEPRYSDSQQLRWMQEINKTGLYEFPVAKQFVWEEKYDCTRFLAWIHSIDSIFAAADSEQWECYVREIRSFFSHLSEPVTITQIGMLVQAKRKQIGLHENLTYIPTTANVPIYDLTEIATNPGIVETHFLTSADEMLYINQDEKLFAVISIGDVIRFWRGETQSLFNRTYRCIWKGNEQSAQDVFEKIPTIHELPVVQDGILVGIIRSGASKAPTEWKRQREQLLSQMDESMRRHVRHRINLNDLFCSLPVAEQRTLLEKQFSPEYVRLFLHNYISEGL